MTKKFKQVLTMLLAVTILVTGLPAIEAKAKDGPCGDCVKCGHSESSHEENCWHCNNAGKGACKDSNNYVACVLDSAHTQGAPTAHSATQLPATCYCANPEHNVHFYVYDISTGGYPEVSGASYFWGDEELKINLEGRTKTEFLEVFQASAKQGKWYAWGKGICEAAGGIPEVPCAPKEAPAEPPTPAEELRAVEEEALPLAIVEKDKTQVAKDEAGIVPDKSYNLSAYVTTKGFVSALNKIAKANPEAKSVSIFTGKAFTFNKNIVEAINKGGKEVVYYFKHAGHLYSVTVPANVDATKVLEKGGHAGPLYVGKVLGTTTLVK